MGNYDGVAICAEFTERRLQLVPIRLSVGVERRGKGYCFSHRIHEETLDAMVWEYSSAVREGYAEELKKLAQLQKMWALRKPILNAHILSLQEKVQELEIDEIVMEQLCINTGVFPCSYSSGGST